MKYYVTLTGLNYRFGTQPFAVGQKVKLVKEPENDFDREAIRAELPGLGKVGYVANNPSHCTLCDGLFCTFLLRRTYTGQRGNVS